MSIRSRTTYTFTDKAPVLVTYSLLPIIRASAAFVGIDVGASDISLAEHVLTSFTDRLDADQRIEGNLARLTTLVTSSDTNIIKLPNINASVPQLKDTVAELQDLGYRVPGFPEDPQTNGEKEVRIHYAEILGSTVNPVLHEGNFDRHAPATVRIYVREHPHPMSEWSMASYSYTDYIRGGDFFSSEQPITMTKVSDVRIEFVGKDDKVEAKKQLNLQEDEVPDGVFVSCGRLHDFFEKTLQDYKEAGVIWSLRVKATMMKISHPTVSGHAVNVYYKDIFGKWGQLLGELGVNPGDGISDAYDEIKSPPASQQKEILRNIHGVYSHRPGMTMIDSVRGVTNPRIPNNIVVDTSMSAIICSSGQMWDRDDKQKGTKAAVPESTYTRIYQEMVNFYKTDGAFGPTTMGSMPNVGLMTQRAEEYGSHDKTFEITADGTIRVALTDDSVLMQYRVETGDTWRTCQTKNILIRDWVRPAVIRAHQFDTPAIFWLSPGRAHDREPYRKVGPYLKDYDLTDLDINIMDYNEVIHVGMECLTRSKDTISMTGSALRDYPTDLFPIMELSILAKIPSIVLLIAGDGMYETGTGGSAPEHVQQLAEENYLRWNSLGEFLALIVSLERIGIKTDNVKTKLLGKALDEATDRLLDNNKSPSYKVGDIDNRGSHFYLAVYWTQALATQDEDVELKAHFAPPARALTEQEAAIIAELSVIQGEPTEISGYHRPNSELTSKMMRPSATFDAAIDNLA